MRPNRCFASFEEFAREELRSHRSSTWCLDDLTDDFVVCADLDLDLDDQEDEEEEEEEE